MNIQLTLCLHLIKIWHLRFGCGLKRKQIFSTRRSVWDQGNVWGPGVNTHERSSVAVHGLYQYIFPLKRGNNFPHEKSSQNFQLTQNKAKHRADIFHLVLFNLFCVNSTINIFHCLKRNGNVTELSLISYLCKESKKKQ